MSLNTLDRTRFLSVRLRLYTAQCNSMTLSLSSAAEFREFQAVLFQSESSSVHHLFFLSAFSDSTRSLLSSAEILYFPQKWSPDSEQGYSSFLVRKVLPLRTEIQTSDISSYTSAPYTRIPKQTEMYLCHFFLISRIFSESIFLFFYANLLEP